MTPASSDSALPGGLHPKRIGPYAIREKIGSGGMATVYRAYHAPVEREVALKVLAIQFQDQPDVRARFQREAYMLQQFDHPHILPVYDFGEEGEALYLVMRLLDGRSLLSELEAGALPHEELGRYTREIASALDYAHARGIIHRDIKPANILLDDNKTVLLADFGVAHPTADDARLTTAGSFIGTAAYASPEQCRGDTLDRRSDIYSLAVLTFQMATGELPFKASSAIALIKLHLTARPPNPLAYNNALPIELYDVLVRGLAKNPDDRYPSAMKFSEAVDRALGIHVLPDMDASEHWLVGDISPVTFGDELSPISPVVDDTRADDLLAANAPENDSANKVITFDDLPQTGTVGDPFAGVQGDEYDASELHFDDYVELDAPEDDISFATAFGSSVAGLVEEVAQSEPEKQVIRPIGPIHASSVRRPTTPKPPRESARENPPHTGLYALVLASALVLALVAALVMIALRLSSINDDLEPRTVYADPTLGITFDYPSNWYLQLGLAAVLSREATATVALSDAPVALAGPYDGAQLVITIQQIDPVAVFGVPVACQGLLRDGPQPTFDCMTRENYTTPVYTAFRSARAHGVRLPGTLPPTAASPPLVLLATGDAPWIALTIAHWDGYAGARTMLDEVARSVR